MRTRDYIWLWIFLLLATSISSWASTSNLLTAFVDKTQVNAGESLVLTIEYRGKTRDEPDLSSLQQDFTVLSRQTSTESSFVQGNFSSKTSFIFEILPKSSKKTVVIPAISLGSEQTTPISITQTTGKAIKNPEGINLSVTTDKSSVYINAELILNIEIKTRLLLRNGTLSTPEIKDAIVEPLIEDTLSESVENGVKFFIFRRSYAIFPSKVGELKIPPLVFRGVTVGESPNQRAWPSFFNAGQKISARSEEISVNVKDIPQEYPSDQPFLPLKSFVIIDSFDEANPKFEVNKATTRRYEIKAKGTLASFLPEIAPPVVKDLQIYTEKGNKIHKNIADGLEASADFSHVYMPTAPGKILIPAHDVVWWDTENDRLKTMTVRALEIDVGGTVAKVPTMTPPSREEKNEPEAEEQSEKRPSPFVKTEKQKWLIVGTVVILAVASIVFLLVYNQRRRRRGQNGFEPTLSQELRIRVIEIIATSKERDAKAMYRQLQTFRAWALKNDVSFLWDEQIDTLFKDLERALFDVKDVHDTHHIVDKIKQKFTAIRLPKMKKPVLVELYPN